MKSHIAYNIKIYTETSKINLNKILHLQNVSIKVILKQEVRNRKITFSDLGILTV